MTTAEEREEALIEVAADLGLEIAQLKARLAAVMEALKTVQPYFEGEHHPDHPACVALRQALADQEPKP